MSAGLFLAGVVAWGGFNWSLELTNTERFCLSCHEMRQFVFAEYKGTAHDANRSGVRATCPDCHVPREWIHKVVRKVRATNELFHWLTGSIAARERFEARRLTLARHVWSSMKASNSRECRNCHDISAMSAKAQEPQARIMHELASRWRMTCIDCHKGIAHSLPRDFDKEADMDRLHERMARERIACRRCHEGMAAPPQNDGWD